MSNYDSFLRVKEIFEDLDRHSAEQYIAVRLLRGMGIKKKDRDDIERAIWGRASTGAPDFERALHIFQFLLEKKCGFTTGTYDAGIMFGRVSEKDDILPKLTQLASTTDQPLFLFAAPDSSKYCYTYFIIPEKLFSKLQDNFILYKHVMWPRSWHPDGNKICIKQDVEIFVKQIGDPFQLTGITSALGPLHASYAAV